MRRPLCTPEGPYTRRQSLYTSHGSLLARRALHVAKQLYPYERHCPPSGLTRATGSLHAVRLYPPEGLYTLHVLQHLTRRMPLHAALLPYSGKGHYSQRSCLTLRSTYNFNLNAPLRQPEHEETIIYRIIVMVEKYKVILN